LKRKRKKLFLKEENRIFRRIGERKTGRNFSAERSSFPMTFPGGAIRNAAKKRRSSGPFSRGACLANTVFGTLEAELKFPAPEGPEGKNRKGGDADMGKNTVDERLVEGAEESGNPKSCVRIFFASAGIEMTPKILEPVENKEAKHAEAMRRNRFRKAE
jgi:hypothetical protein